MCEVVNTGGPHAQMSAGGTARCAAPSSTHVRYLADVARSVNTRACSPWTERDGCLQSDLNRTLARSRQRAGVYDLGR